MSDCEVTAEQSGILIGNGFYHYESGDVVHLTGPNGGGDIHITDLQHAIEQVEFGTDPITGESLFNADEHDMPSEELIILDDLDLADTREFDPSEFDAEGEF